MPIQQTTSEDMHSTPQKLSKIETLRLAKNYIVAMSLTLQEGRPMPLQRFIKILSRELSQTTANLLTGTLMGFGNKTNNLQVQDYSYVERKSGLSHYSMFDNTKHWYDSNYNFTNQFNESCIYGNCKSFYIKS